VADELTAKVVVTGDSASAQAAIKQLQQTIQGAASQIKSHFEAIQAAALKLQTAMLAITGVIAGGEAFNKIIDATKEWEGNSIALGKSLGISASEASDYAVAIEDVGGKTDDFDAATRGLTRSLRTHEDQLNKMGIVTRDSSGHLRGMKDIMLDAITVVNGYTAGTDRNLAAQVAFGKSVTANSPVLRLTKEGMDEAAKSAEELGLVVSQQNVAAFAENRKATAEAKDTMLGMAKAIGDALLPVLTQLAKWFREIGPGAIVVIKGAVGGLVAAFWVLKAACDAIASTLLIIAGTVADVFTGIGSAVWKAAHGDFKGAGEAMKGIAGDVALRWKTGFQDIVGDAKDAASKIYNLFAEGDKAQAPGKGKSFDLEKKQRSPDDRLKEWKVQLDAIKEAEGAFRQHDIAADIDYWQQKMSLVTGTSEADKKLRTSIEAEILAAKKKLHAEELALDEESAKQRERMGLEEIQIKKAALADELAAGEITKEQELAETRKLEQQRFQIEAQGLRERLALVQADRVQRLKVMDEIALAEKKHDAELLKIDKQADRERMKLWNDFFKSLQSGFQGVIKNFLDGTATLAQTIQGLFKSIVDAVINEIARMAAEWAAQHLAMWAIKKLTSLGIIKASAGEAMAAGTASFAGAPWPVDLGAPAFGIAMGAAAESASASVAAAGGYDVPAGVTPVTKLHPKEMVLPAHLANAVRSMAAAGTGQGPQASRTRASSLSVNVKGSGDYFMVHRSDLVAAIKQAHREFRFA